MFKFITSLIVSILLLSPNTMAFEREHLQVGVSEIPFMLSQFDEKKGDYNRLLEKMPELELIFMPPARAGRMFDKKQIDCLFPASTTTMEVAFEVIQSLPVSKVSAFVFSLQPYLGIEQLQGKTVALRRGFSFGNVRERFKANYIELESEARAIQFLLRGRVDAVIGYQLDVQNAEKELGIEALFFNRELPLYSAEEAFVCHDSELNRDLFKRINPIIQNFK